ncbi:ferredoxin thioredoxin reductase beta chain [Cyanobacterium stanieri PCC 7202]|uniref:Ferredoxin-thioredoxin reductase, catalytic chain n=1 Tax=Cyanobacterium stanieri (strain ATCC 29140 / PCC 7202) TaxID=292563 RepID=K9YPD7_CYASC|nr:ferredoxin thioredoxin reductase beta chain [Cyanobacterium stanieri PCC 7202]
MTSENQNKKLEAMKNFAEQYAKRTDTYFCSEPSVTAVVIQGLAQHKEELGAPLCPCRYYEDKEAEVKNTFWNCPCVPMRERKECHCMLFITPDNEFAGEKQEISWEDLQGVK